MPSRFDAALARADAAQLRVFGEDCTFRDPTGSVEDAPVVIVFSERDIAEPPNNMSAAKGQYSKGWATLASLPVGNPDGYELIVGLIVYAIRRPVADGAGGVEMLLHKVRVLEAEPGALSLSTLTDEQLASLTDDQLAALTD